MPLPPRKDKYQKTVQGYSEREIRPRITCTRHNTGAESAPWVNLKCKRYWVMSLQPLILKTEDNVNTWITIIKEK